MSAEGDNRYSKPSFLASYLDAEWSDLLFPSETRLKSSEAHPEKLDPRQYVGPSFYLRMIELLAKHVAAERVESIRFCDVGSATGRTVYEWLLRFPATGEVVLCEMSSMFSEYSRRLLLSPESIDSVPLVGMCGTTPFRQPLAIPPKIVKRPDRLQFFNVPVEHLPFPPDSFDIMTCLNVADRHPNPAELVRVLRRFLKPGGLLVFASPMDWNADFTPRENWVGDLRHLFDKSWVVDESHDEPYDFRYSSRRVVRFLTQVVVAHGA